MEAEKTTTARGAARQVRGGQAEGFVIAAAKVQKVLAGMRTIVITTFAMAMAVLGLSAVAATPRSRRRCVSSAIARRTPLFA